MNLINHVSVGGLDRLNRSALNQLRDIRALFGRLRAERTILNCGINRKNEARTARVTRISTESVSLVTRNFDEFRQGQIFFSFKIDGSEHFFAASTMGTSEGSELVIEFPGSIYQAERRGVLRDTERTSQLDGHNIEVGAPLTPPSVARVVDSSTRGLGIAIRGNSVDDIPQEFAVRFLDGSRKGESAIARLKYSVPGTGDYAGWVRIGLSLNDTAPTRLINVDRRRRIVEKSPVVLAKEGLAFARSVIQSARGRADPTARVRKTRFDVVSIERFTNGSGHEIVAIVDKWGDPKSATAVVIPPAWGRTKETLLPLARTIVETFARANEPVVVLRFDGTLRKGESYIPPNCRVEGREYLKFTFSQAAADIKAAIEFLSESPSYGPKRIVLTTFSLAAIEGRRAIASDTAGLIDGWISVVGMVDLQSALRMISGGIDYAYGLSRGVKFGRHELVGVVADMDHTGLDAIESRMVFLDDARSEMAKIGIPVTWIHGRDDAWMNIERVRDLLSCGEVAGRHLIEVPTGHQLRTSRVALATFQLIAEEISLIAIGRRLPAGLPNLRDLSERELTERNRRPKQRTDTRSFWRDYLLGRDRRIGMQLLTATTAYKNLMAHQLSLLDLKHGDRIADLGAGTGEFSLSASLSDGTSHGLTICEIDYVSEALKRGISRLRDSQEESQPTVLRMVADLDLIQRSNIPLKDCSCNAVLASLLIGYLEDPLLLLPEAYRILSPGGSLVVSSLRRDADISKLFVDGLSELKNAGFARKVGFAESEFDELARDFLNDASRILTLEEQGRFRFWDAEELATLLRTSGFVGVKIHWSLGNPPQAAIASGLRPKDIP